jgi:hypothetical protein
MIFVLVDKCTTSSAINFEKTNHFDYVSDDGKSYRNCMCICLPPDTFDRQSKPRLPNLHHPENQVRCCIVRGIVGGNLKALGELYNTRTRAASISNVSKAASPSTGKRKRGQVNYCLGESEGDSDSDGSYEK